MAVLLLGPQSRKAVWSEEFARAGETLWLDEAPDPAQVRVLACWQPPTDLSLYERLELVLSVGAGVDQIEALPAHLRLARTLAIGIEQMVRDWVVMAALMLHRAMPLYLAQAQEGIWAAHPVQAASGRRVGIMGTGRTGQLAAQSLARLGFETACWSRSGQMAGAEGIALYAGHERDAFLARTDLLICLLPLTQETRGILSQDCLAKLPKGALLVHAGRGAQLDLDALQVALGAGQIAGAMLDVVEPEPLPRDHWLWRHPQVIVTPHIAAQTDSHEGAAHALTVLRALRAGLPVPGEIDRFRGY